MKSAEATAAQARAEGQARAKASPRTSTSTTSSRANIEPAANAYWPIQWDMGGMVADMVSPYRLFRNWRNASFTARGWSSMAKWRALSMGLTSSFEVPVISSR